MRVNRPWKAAGKRVAPCQNKFLPSDHCPQGSSELRLDGVDNLYIPTSSLAICFYVLDDSGPSVETCIDTERHACPQPAAFLSDRKWVLFLLFFLFFFFVFNRA